ncbi:MAG: hypothetical protein HQK73_11990 [Desulfamplus sp.]|nr:hypothetical protein [Desulfamplus sp.]MBF0412685.1 hypothetical protein [Desulfamplus sp.]
MGHEDAGHYAMKHNNKTTDPKIAAILEKEAVNSTITCKKLHAIAKNLGIKPKEVGIQADLMELRLKECSLGLFGYEPDGKNLNKDIEISESLSSEIQKMAPNGRTSCIQCWEVASKLNIEKKEVGSACDKMGIKIKQCQLGAF